MPDPDLIARLDRAIAELQAIRAEVTAFLPAPVVEGNGLDADDMADSNLLDTTSAAERPRRQVAGERPEA